MVRPIALLLAILALSVPGARSAAAAPPTSSGAAPRARAHAPRARLATPPGEAHRLRGAGTALRRPEAPPKRAPKPPPPPPAISIGHPNDGRLEGAVRLDTSRKEIRVVPAYAGEDVRWGLPSLVHMIERAARAVAKRYPGSVLDVGDLSRKEGGEVHRHHSHESGRDADIGFYAVDASGKQVQAKTFIRIGPRLASSTVPGARLDVGRTWLLIQELLTDPRAHVSHIFISDPLRYALLTHAKRIGVSRALLVRAQLAVMQPTGAEAHDDHLHVRISCPASMRGSCVELAKNAPSFRDRLRSRAARVLRTPGRGRGAPAPGKRDGSSAAAPPAPRGGRASREHEDASHEASRTAPKPTPPPAARGASQGEPMDGGFDLDFLRGAARDDDQASEDDEAKGALDDSGTLKITD